MTLFTNILIVLLLIVAIAHIMLNIYNSFLNRKENLALITLQETFNNAQQEFSNQKKQLLETINERNEHINYLSSKVKALEDELTLYKKQY